MSRILITNNKMVKNVITTGKFGFYYFMFFYPI